MVIVMMVLLGTIDGAHAIGLCDLVIWGYSFDVRLPIRDIYVRTYKNRS